MSGWIFVDKDKDSQGQMRENMRRNMRRGGYRNYGGSSMRENYNDGYRQGTSTVGKTTKTKWTKRTFVVVETAEVALCNY